MKDYTFLYTDGTLAMFEWARPYPVSHDCAPHCFDLDESALRARIQDTRRDTTEERQALGALLACRGTA